MVVEKTSCNRVVVMESSPDGGVRQMVVKHVTIYRILQLPSATTLLQPRAFPQLHRACF
jgi:hypothetical protein